MGIKDYYTTGHKILRFSAGASGFGGVSGTWGTHLTVSGRLRPLSGDERLSADKKTVFATHRFYTDVADIKKTDRYQNPDGKTYDIKFVKDPMSMGHHLEIDLELSNE